MYQNHDRNRITFKIWPVRFIVLKIIKAYKIRKRPYKCLSIVSIDWLKMLYSSLVISSLETTSGAHIVKFPSCIINVKFLLSRCAAKCYLYYARFHLCSLQQQFFSHPLRLHLRDRLNGNMSRYVLVVSIVQ